WPLAFDRQTVRCDAERAMLRHDDHDGDRAAVDLEAGVVHAGPGPFVDAKLDAQLSLGAGRYPARDAGFVQTLAMTPTQFGAVDLRAARCERLRPRIPPWQTAPSPAVLRAEYLWRALGRPRPRRCARGHSG